MTKTGELLDETEVEADGGSEAARIQFPQQDAPFREKGVCAHVRTVRPLP